MAVRGVEEWMPAYGPSKSARLFVGLNVGRKQAYRIDDVVWLVTRMRESQGASPDSTFITQRGIYSQPGVGKVDEKSVQVVIYDDSGTAKSRWKSQMLGIAKHLANSMCQDSVVVDLRENNVSYWVGGVKGNLSSAKCQSQLQRAANPKLVVINPKVRGGLTAAQRKRVKASADPRELAMGIAEEMEHTTSKRTAERIALDHLAEDPHYYTKLAEAMGHNPAWLELVAGGLVGYGVGRAHGGAKCLVGRAKRAAGRAKKKLTRKKDNPKITAKKRRKRKVNPKGGKFRGTKAEVLAFIERTQGRKLTAAERRLFDKMARQAQTFHGTDDIEVVVGDAPSGTPKILAGAGPLLNVDYKVVNKGSHRKGEWTHKAGDHARQRMSPPAWAAWGPDGRMVVVDAHGSRMRMKPTHGYVG
jgi:hypothetical protein